MAAVDITTIGIEYDTSGLDKGTRAQDKTRESANKLGDSVDKTEKSFSSLNKILGIAAGAMAAVGGVMLAKQFTETADAVSLMDARLKMATGSLEDFKQAQKDIYAISQANNAGIKETSQLYTKLYDPVKNLGGGMKEVRAITEAFALTLRIGGASASETASSITQFGQAMGSANLAGDEFKSLSENNPKLLKILSVELNKTQAELKKMGSEGLLATDVIGNALIKSLNKLKDEAKSIPDTVSGSITRFKNDVILAVGEISNSQGFTVGFAGLIEQARGLIPVIKDEVMGAFVAVNGWIERNKEEIGKVWELSKGIVGQVWELAKGAFSVVGFISELVFKSGEVSNTFKGILFLLAGLQDGVKAIGALFAYVGSQIFQAVLAPLQFVLETSAKIAGVFDDKMAANIRAVGKDIDDFAKGGENYAKSVADAFGNGESAVGRLNAEMGKSIQASKDVKKAIDESAGANANLKVAAALSSEQLEKMNKWLGQNGTAAHRMAAAMKQAKEEVGVLTPEMEKLIKAKFIDKSIAKEAAFEESARHKMYLTHVKAEQSIQDQINKDAKQFASDQIARTKEVTKEIIAGINEQSKAFLSYNKSLDDHAQRMSDMNTLAQLEIDTLGMSSVQRNTLIEQKKIELALEKQLKDIRASNMAQGEKDILEEKAKTQANIDKSTAELRAQQGEWSKFYGEIYNGLSDSLYRGFEAGKGFGKSFLDSIKNLFKTNVIKIAVQAVMGGVSGMVSGAASAMSGGGGSGIGLGNALNIGSTLMKGFTAAGAALNTSLATGIGELGATMGSEFMLSVSSMMQGGAASGAAGSVAGGLTSAATAMPYVAAAVAAFQGMKAINSGYRLGGLSADAGAAIFGIAPRLFGRKAPELQQSELSGSVGADGFNATTRDVYMAKGGLFRSDKWSEVKNPLAGASELSDQYNAISAVAKSYADLLGLSTESLASFSKSFTFNLSKTGDAKKDAEANQKLINDLFVGITNDITNLLAPSISAFGKEGENVSQTFQRLAMSLTNVNSILKAVGFAEFGKSLEGANAAQRLSDLTGGIEKLAEGSQYFYENFLTESEKIKPIADQVSAAMAAMGQSSVDTVEEFKLLVRGLDLSTQSGAEMYAKLIAIAPAFKAVADSASSVLEGVNAAKSALDSAKSNYQSALQAVASGLEALSAKVVAAKSAESQAQNNISNAYFAAQDAVMSAQNRIAELARQSADALKTISGGIKDFVASLAGGAYGLSTANLRKSLTDTAAAARGGDTAAQTSLTGIAQKFLSQSRETSGSALAFARDQSMVRTLLTGVSNSIDKKIVDIKSPAVVDPMVAAQAELVSAQKRLADYSALAAATGANMDRSLVTVAGSITSLLEEYKKTHEDRLKAQSDYSIAQALVTNLGATANTSQTGFVALIEAAIKAKEAMANAQTGLSDAIVKAAAGTQTSVDDFAKSLGLTGESAALLKTALGESKLSTDGYKSLMDKTGLTAIDLAKGLTGGANSSFDMALILSQASKTGGTLKDRMDQAGIDSKGLSDSLSDPSKSADALGLIFGKNVKDATQLSKDIISASDGAGSLKGAADKAGTSSSNLASILSGMGLSVEDFNDLVEGTGLSSKAILDALGTKDSGLQGAVIISDTSLTNFAGKAKSAGLSIKDFNDLLSKNGLTATSWDGLKDLTNSDSDLLAEYLNLGAGTSKDLSQKFSDVKSASDAIKARMDAFTLPSVSLDFSGLQSAANSMAQLMAQFKLPVASANDGGASAGSGGGKSADQMIVESWYSNHPNANKTNDPLGIAYWVSDIQKNGMLNAKRAFADSVAATTGTQALSIEKFATGGTFTNGIVKRPTNFNIGQMGENGGEGVFPVTNVGGKLGVAGIVPKNNDELNEKLLAAVDGLAKRLDKIETNTKESARTLNTVTRNGRAMQTELFA